MATKLYNSHLKTILESSKSGYVIDTYIALVHISCEINGKYLIQTCDNSKNTLVSILKNIVKSTPKTIYNCLGTLLDLNIVKYDEDLNAWTLSGMENMTKAKVDASYVLHTGYTHIRKFFLTTEFSAMKSREKRLIIYMAQLSDSKSSTFHNGFSVNLSKYNSAWLKIINTKSKYYAKYTIEKLLSNYKDLFINKTDNLRVNDLSPAGSKKFKFSFNCNSIENKNSANDDMEQVKLHNPNDHLLIMEKISFAEITLTKQKIMHITRAISNLKDWFLKDRVVQIIVNKYKAIQIYKSREDIKSLPAYASAVARTVLLEYKDFKSNFLSINVANARINEMFLNSTSDFNTDLINKGITESLAKM